MHDRRSKVYAHFMQGLNSPFFNFPSRISTVCNMQATVNYHVYINSIGFEDKVISGAKTSSLPLHEGQMIYPREQRLRVVKTTTAGH